MGGLRRRMDNELDVAAVLLEHPLHLLPVTNVFGAVGVVGQRLLQPFAAPVGRGFRAEEKLAHVVVDAYHVKSLPVEEARRFRADQARRPGNNGNLHDHSLILNYNPFSWLYSVVMPIAENNILNQPIFVYDSPLESERRLSCYFLLLNPEEEDENEHNIKATEWQPKIQGQSSHGGDQGRGNRT